MLLTSTAQSQAQIAASGVTVVLAGGGAKGFAHLAVLRRLEQDGVRIEKIIGTSMGAIIGGLYASGSSLKEIEQVVGGQEAGRVGMDQVGRTELPQRLREFQQQYPLGFEFGYGNGKVGFARAASDGQRLLSMLQELTHHVPVDSHFDRLKIPFRAVATRYRDGAMKVFDSGSLPMAIRASMAAPGVFAPVHIDGELYADGGLVSNLPVDVALQEGAGRIVASYLGEEATNTNDPRSAIEISDRVISILILQNERRNLALLRPQDILVRTAFTTQGFVDFNRAAEIVQLGDVAINKLETQFQALARELGRTKTAVDKITLAKSPPPDSAKLISKVLTRGNVQVPSRYIEQAFAPLIGNKTRPSDIAKYIDQLYTEGYFETVHYDMQALPDDQWALTIDVEEKPYGPHLFSFNMSLFTEASGTNLYALGVGYRRPWLTPSGLELRANVRLGTLQHGSMQLHQPITPDLSANAVMQYERTFQPLYKSPSAVKAAYVVIAAQETGGNLTYQLARSTALKMGVQSRTTSALLDTEYRFSYTDPITNQVQQLPASTPELRYVGTRLELSTDKLDSLSFPTQGYAVRVMTERQISGTPYRSARLNTRFATNAGRHVFGIGVNLGVDERPAVCSTCIVPAGQYLGGFQFMGSFKLGQLAGDKVAHMQGTYMYQLGVESMFNQRRFIGLVAEAGDAWSVGEKHSTKYSGTLFVAVDSKIGDLYMGLARGSLNSTNVFLQLGRRFTLF